MGSLTFVIDCITADECVPTSLQIMRGKYRTHHKPGVVCKFGNVNWLVVCLMQAHRIGTVIGDSMTGVALIWEQQ